MTSNITNIADLLPPNVPSPALVYRAGFYGYMAATVLTGITIVQAYIYWQSGKGSWFLRSLVLLLLAIDILGTLVITVFWDHVLIVNYGNLAVLPVIPPYFAAEILGTGIITTSVQIFMAWQINKLSSRWRPASIAITILSSIEFILSLLVTASLVKTQTVQITSQLSFELVAGIWNGIAALVDIIATIALCTILASARGAFMRMNTFLNELMIFLINRGILLTVSQLFFLGFWYSNSKDLLWVPFHFCLAKLYVNTFLTMLNTTATAKQRNAHGFENSANISSSKNRFAFSPSSRTYTHPNPIASNVYISTVTEVSTMGTQVGSNEDHKYAVGKSLPEAPRASGGVY